MKVYPLLFTFRDLIRGSGFVAGVKIKGKVLLVIEDDGDHWMYGVQPGGIAGGGRDRATAFAEFKKSYLSVLFDTAETVTSFQKFRSYVKTFFNELNRPNDKAWKTARAAVRQTTFRLTGLERVNSDKHPPHLEIVLLDVSKTTPANNKFDIIAEAA